jgi:hypothetical protein
LYFIDVDVLYQSQKQRLETILRSRSMTDDLFFSRDYQLSNVDSAARLRDLEDFYTATPEVKQLINDAYLEVARAKKLVRLEQQADEADLFNFHKVEFRPAGIAACAKRIEVGRPQSNPLLIFVCLTLCVGSYNGFGRKAMNLLKSCRFLQSFCKWNGFELPKKSTIHEANGIIGPERLAKITSLHIAYGCKILKDKGQEEQLKEIVADSSPLVSASAKPCHEANAARLLGKAEKAILAAEAELAMPPQKSLAGPMKTATGELLMGASGSQAADARADKGKDKAKQAAQRRQKFLQQSRKSWGKGMVDAAEKLDSRLEKARAKLSLSTQSKLGPALDRAESEIMTCQRIVEAVSDIWVYGIAVAKEHDFPFSCSDDDASFIVKGGRPTIFGYKLQLAMTRRGFILSALLPIGNNSDSANYVPLLDEVKAAIGKAPEMFTVDDGYPSAANLAYARKVGVVHPVFKGAKSKKLLGAEYDTVPQQRGRNNRSAAEGGISRGKNDYHLGEATSFGHDAVKGEVSLKVLASNTKVLRHIIDPKNKLAHLCAPPALHARAS